MLVNVLAIRVELAVDSFERIGANNTTNRWVLHDSKLIECLATLGRVTSLLAIALAHRLLSIDVVVGLTLLLAEVHAATSPVGSKSTGLNAGELDSPLWLDLVREGLGEAFYGPLGGAVDAEHGHTTLATNGSDLLDHTTLRLLGTHSLHGNSGDVNQTEEVNLHLVSVLVSDAVACVRYRDRERT